MNTIELRKQITVLLKSKHTRVFSENAPKDTQFPYVTYDLPDSSMVSQREDFKLIIDVWDTSNDTTAIETLVGNIDGDGDPLSPSGLDNKTFYVSGVMSATLHKTGRFNVPDTDRQINRRQLRYTVQTYQK